MTSTTEETGAALGEIFKRDARGRVRVPRTRREALLDEFERSGGSAAQFAAYVGLRYSTFANWVNNRRRQRSDQQLTQGSAESVKRREGVGAVRWFEAVVESGGNAVRNQATLRGVCQVVRIWKSRTCNKACLPLNYCKTWAGWEPRDAKLQWQSQNLPGQRAVRSAQRL